MKEQTSQDAVYTFLGLCATALGPLTCDDLRALAPGTFPRQVQVDRAARHVARFIIGDGSAEAGYVFSHPIQPNFRRFG